MLLPILAAAALSQGGGGSLTALVDDPLSHGLLGDSLLSLDEAIRLANGTLALSALSPAERARVTGTGSDVLRIVVDRATVPAITLQAPLTEVAGQGPTVGRVEIVGMPAGGMGGMAMPELHGGAHAHLLALRSPLVTVMGLCLHDGQVGIDARMAPVAGVPPAEMAMVMDCEFDAQTTAGVRLHAVGTDRSVLMVTRARLVNMPTGFLVEDHSVGGSVMGENEFVTMDGVALGCDVVENGTGSLSMWMLFRSEFANGATLLRKRRGAGSTQQFMFRIVHCRAECSADVTDVQGAANGLTMFHHHHSDFLAGPGGKAFWVHPRTAEFDVHGSEMLFEGDVEIAANRFTQRVWQQNNEYRSGTVLFDVDGALPNLYWNRFANCTVRVPAAARSPVTIRASELRNTAVDGQSLFAPIALQGCHRAGGALTGQASESSPAPAPFLGTAAVTPTEAPIGTTVRLSADLPFGFGGVWFFTVSYPRPTTTIEPVRYYGDAATAVRLPGMVVFQSHVDVPIPNGSYLVGHEFYLQAVTVPLLGQTYAPSYHFPRSGLLRPVL